MGVVCGHLLNYNALCETKKYHRKLAANNKNIPPNSVKFVFIQRIMLNILMFFSSFRLFVGFSSQF